VIGGTKAEEAVGRRFIPRFVGFVKEACWSMEERLVGGKSFRMREGVGSERGGYNVFLVYGGNDVLVGKGVMCSTAEFATDTVKVSLKDILWIGQLRLTR
jgi:hypothetical protein